MMKLSPFSFAQYNVQGDAIFFSSFLSLGVQTRQYLNVLRYFQRWVEKVISSFFVERCANRRLKLELVKAIDVLVFDAHAAR
jgi:hypothetical protein